MQRDFCRPLGVDENSGWEPPIDIYEIERQLWVYAARNQRPLGVLLQKDPTVDDSGPQQLVQWAHQQSFSATCRRKMVPITPSAAAPGAFVSLSFFPAIPSWRRYQEISTTEIEARMRLLRERAGEALQLLRGHVVSRSPKTVPISI